MSSNTKNVSFRSPLEEVISPAENTRATGRENGRRGIRGATRGGYPYTRDINPAQTIAYPSPYNPNDSTFWRDAGVNKYTALRSHPVHPLHIPSGYTQNVSAGVDSYSPQGTRARYEPRSAIPTAVDRGQALAEELAGGAQVAEVSCMPHYQPLIERARNAPGWDDDQRENRTPLTQRVTRLPHGPTLKVASAADEIIMGTGKSNPNYAVTQLSDPAKLRYVDRPVSTEQTSSEDDEYSSDSSPTTLLPITKDVDRPPIPPRNATRSGVGGQARHNKPKPAPENQTELFSEDACVGDEPPLTPRQQYIERPSSSSAGTRNQTTTLVRAGDLTITLSEPVSPFRASISRNTSMPEVTECATAHDRFPPRSVSLQPLRGLPAEIDSHGPHTTFDEIIPPVSNATARKVFSLRSILQKTRGAEKSRVGRATKSNSRSSSSGAGKTAFKGRKSGKNARNPTTSLGAISTPIVVPTPSLLQQLGRNHIDLSPSQDTPAYLQQAVSTPFKPATPESPNRHAPPTSFATHSMNAMAGHHETLTMPPLPLSRPTEPHRPESNATSDAGVQTEPSANGSAWTCAHFDALSDSVCRKVREANTSAQRDQYLEMALEVQKLLVDYQRLGEVVEDTSKFLNQKMIERKSIETKLRAMMEES
ncbi:similar to An01g13980 [Aspergillus luchuensis]|uniref:Similar to An01g13980 n=1 Tax=Aspergillus kawachii TaxID=1069201 RepID=A0A146FAD3_ASPKA|nr:similar to An01g13980 [Aspergillus luchuensis]